MVDLVTLMVSFAGMIFAAISLLTEASESSEKEDSEFIEAIVDSIRNNADGNALDTVLKDYETVNREIERRENINLLVGSILVTASILILGNTATKGIPKFPYAITSIAIFILWLLVLQNTSKKLDAMLFVRTRAIEKALTQSYGYDYGIHTYLQTKTKDKCGETIWWLRIRRGFWSYVLFLTSFAWLLLSST